MFHKTENDQPKSVATDLPALSPTVRPPAPASTPDSSSLAARICQGIQIKGEISGVGDLVMDGAFEGTIDLPDGALTVGPNAKVTAQITAREISIRGEVIGSLKACERVHVWSTGKLTGDMDTRGIVIDDGAMLHSKVATPAKEDSQPSRLVTNPSKPSN